MMGLITVFNMPGVNMRLRGRRSDPPAVHGPAGLQRRGRRGRLRAVADAADAARTFEKRLPEWETPARAGQGGSGCGLCDESAGRGCIGDDDDDDD